MFLFFVVVKLFVIVLSIAWRNESLQRIWLCKCASGRNNGIVYDIKSIFDLRVLSVLKVYTCFCCSKVHLRNENVYHPFFNRLEWHEIDDRTINTIDINMKVSWFNEYLDITVSSSITLLKIISKSFCFEMHHWHGTDIFVYTQSKY